MLPERNQSRRERRLKREVAVPRLAGRCRVPIRRDLNLLIVLPSPTCPSANSDTSFPERDRLDQSETTIEATGDRVEESYAYAFSSDDRWLLSSRSRSWSRALKVSRLYTRASACNLLMSSRIDSFSTAICRQRTSCDCIMTAIGRKVILALSAISLSSERPPSHLNHLGPTIAQLERDSKFMESKSIALRYLMFAELQNLQ